MKKRKIGVMVESFRLGVKDGIRKAAEIGADGFQVYCTSGEMAPENLDKTHRKDFRKFVVEQGLVISALCTDYGYGFLDAQKNRELVKKIKACMDLAVDLGTNVITTHIGKLPADENHPQWQSAREAIADVSNHGISRGVYFAVETGPESPEHLRRFLEAVDSKGVKVNYDPANLVMNGFDQLEGVKTLGDYIVHTHAKDGLKGEMKEVPLGEGAVNFPEWLARLDEIGYDGFLTIEREVGDDPISDIVKARNYLRTL